MRSLPVANPLKTRIPSSMCISVHVPADDYVLQVTGVKHMCCSKLIRAGGLSFKIAGARPGTFPRGEKDEQGEELEPHIHVRAPLTMFCRSRESSAVLAAI